MIGKGLIDIRGRNISKHIIFNLIYKLLSVSIGLFTIPLTIKYLNTVQYGVWVTLLSIMSWISFFDMGFGLGLRNKLTECVSRNDMNSVRSYITTGYIVIGTFVGLIWMLMVFIAPLIDLNKIFNTSQLVIEDLLQIVLVTGSFILGNFLLSLINQLYYAFQNSSMPGFIQLISNVCSLILIYGLTVFTVPKFSYFAFSYGIATVLVYVIFTIYLFYRNPVILPRIMYFDTSKIKDIATIGLKFFVLQLSCLVIFSTSNIMITQLLGPEHVRSYDIAFKIFSIIPMAHTILMTPLWGAFTDAYIKNEIHWIKSVINKLIFLMFPVVLLAIFLANHLVIIAKLWLGIDMEFPEYLAESMAFYVVVSSWNNIFAYFLNGINKIEIQIYCGIAGALLNIPLAIYFVKFLGLGSTGIILAVTSCLLLSSIIVPIQVSYLLKK